MGKRQWSATGASPNHRRRPHKRLKFHQRYFAEITGKRIANICGSIGKRAVALSLLGAEVTVFDISEENQRYALELAKAAQTSIDYVVGNFMEIDQTKFSSYFDMLYLEGGILHYFPDIQAFMELLRLIIKPGGTMVLSDFHPFRKILSINNMPVIADGYFDTAIKQNTNLHRSLLWQEGDEDFPTLATRQYTFDEILTALLGSGFTLREFHEHPSWYDPKLPGEFTIVAEGS